MSNRPKVARAIVVFEDQALLLIRADHDAVRPGDFDLPGGGIDKTDTSIEAGIIREIYEETGIATSEESLEEVIVPGISQEGSNFERHVFVCKVTSTEVRIDQNEHKGFYWLPITEIAQVFRHPFYTPAIEYAIQQQLI